MSDVAIRVDGIGKRYRIGARAERHRDLREALAAAITAPFRNLAHLRSLSRFETDAQSEDTIWALRDVSFEVKQGEVLGIIGRNGAGKSTLLKVLSRITEPTTGRVQVRGRVGALLEVGTGFHPELTGRENVYLNGSILGMDKRYIDRRFDEIVEFSGVEKFIDTPVKRYSSGMYLRLAFSVAAHLEPEILVVDEVLAVGDAEFQKKCLGKMEQVSGEGRTVLFVSHNMSAVITLCRRVLQMRQGTAYRSGPAEAICATYLSESSASTGTSLKERADRSGSGVVRVLDVRFENAEGQAIQEVMAGEELRIALEYEAKRAVERVTFQVGVYAHTGVAIFHCSSAFTGQDRNLDAGRGAAYCTIPRLALPEGEYRINVGVAEFGVDSLDHVEAAATFAVIGGRFFPSGKLPPARSGVALADHAWSIRTTHNRRI